MIVFTGNPDRRNCPTASQKVDATRGVLAVDRTHHMRDDCSRGSIKSEEVQEEELLACFLRGLTVHNLRGPLAFSVAGQEH